MSDTEDDFGRDLRSYGRRRGRKPSARQETLLTKALPQYAVNLQVAPPSPLTRLFPKPVSDVWLEIGFGGGEHLIWQAARNPDAGLIGCEPFEDGVVKALSEIEGRQLANVRLHADDARPLLRWLPDGSIARAFVLFPDPWPKKKHRKRRLVAARLMESLARVLTAGGELRLATDIGDYASDMLLAAASHPAFEWTAKSQAGWRTRPADWPQTRYDRKALREGRRPYFLRFSRS